MSERSSKRVKAEAAVTERKMDVAITEEDRAPERRRPVAPALPEKRAQSKPYRTGFCTIDVFHIEDIRRVTTTTAYYKDGELMFTRRLEPTEKVKHTDDDKVRKIGSIKFRADEKEFQKEEEHRRFPFRDHYFVLTGSTADEPGFNREKLEGLIVALDGHVVRDFERLVKIKGKRFLVAPSCLSTDKYFQCLAAGFPCVSYKWILDAYETQENGGFALAFEKYRLPAGKDNNKLVDWKPREGLLDNAGIGLFGPRGFVSSWTTALRAAKANPVSIEGAMVEENQWPKLECILSNGWVDNAVVRKARANRIPIVKEEWIIQTLIHGEKQAFEKHIAVH